MIDRRFELIVAVVDDDQSVLRSLEYLLESAGYAVRPFTSGIDLLDSSCMAEIACLISDIDMPDMGGYALLHAVRTARPELPVILITGYPETLPTLVRMGEIPRSFTKPFAGDALLAAIAEATKKQS